jgi:predicted ArsR family transcriptional regulator
MKLADYVKKSAIKWASDVSPRHRPRDLSPRTAAILEYVLREQPESSCEVAEALGLSLGLVRNTMDRLQKRGKIQLVHRWEACEIESPTTEKANNNIGR